MESNWILPEVKDPKNWWGGHLWGDKTARFFYYPTAFVVDNLWYNAETMKPDDVRSYDDLLNPKWKGKIGLFDPRQGGAGLAMCSYLWMLKGEDFLKKLVSQQLLVGDRRVVGDALARGKISFTIGATYYTFLPYIKAGLPVKPFHDLKKALMPLQEMEDRLSSRTRRTRMRLKFLSTGFLARKGNRSMTKRLAMLRVAWMWTLPG